MLKQVKYMLKSKIHPRRHEDDNNTCNNKIKFDLSNSNFHFDKKSRHKWGGVPGLFKDKLNKYSTILEERTLEETVTCL